MSTDQSIASKLYPQQAQKPADTPLTPADPAILDEAARAAKLYPNETASAQAAATTPRAPDPVDKVDATPAADTQVKVDELVSEELTPAERIYGDGHLLESAAQYDSAALSGVFNPLENEARSAKDELATAELAEGRKVIADLFVEMRVPEQDAREMTTSLANWSRRWHAGELDSVSDEQLIVARDATLSELRAQWGRKFDAKVELARKTYQEAVKRAPWLEDLVQAGAGNDPKLIKHLAEIGLRNARRAKR